MAHPTVGRVVTRRDHGREACTTACITARTPRFVTGGRSGLKVDESTLARARSVAGLKGCVTNIEARLTIVMTSLAIARWLQDAAGVSIKSLVRGLKPLRAVDVTSAGHTTTAAPTLTTQAQRLINAIHAPGNT